MIISRAHTISLPMFCKARLTKGASRIRIGTSKRYALKVYICSNLTDGDLCTECLKRKRTAQKQNSRLHGLLTEPIPADSHIYGGSWYQEQVERFGEPPSDCINSAKEHQRIAEGWVEGSVGIEPGSRIGEMPLKQTKLCPTKICIVYKESDKPVLKLPTDTYVIKKEMYNGIPVWILPNGKRFDMDEHGEPRKLL